MSTRHLIAIGLVLLLLGLTVEAASYDDTRYALGLELTLPESPHNYAEVGLPEALQGRALRRFDNTPRSNRVTNAGATLGRVLFYDPLLSSTGKVSCASCHKQELAFTDGRRRSRGVHGRLGKRNALSLVNLRFHPTDRYFWDERAASLEAQVLKPIEDEREMAMMLEVLPARIGRRAEYKALFEAAFGDKRITNERIARALAQFVRSMLSFDSRYDEGLASVGDVNKDFPTFSKLENEGKALFFGGRGGGRCSSCHVVDSRRRFGRDGDGDAPLLFVGRTASNNGLDKRADVRDGGVGGVTKDADDLGVFKAPSLRNIALTAPYMHDGRLKTLDAVIQHYNRGVEPHPNLDFRLQGRRGSTPRRLNLTSRERKALVAFLKTLTDRAFITDPRFADPFR